VVVDAITVMMLINKSKESGTYEMFCFLLSIMRIKLANIVKKMLSRLCLVDKRIYFMIVYLSSIIYNGGNILGLFSLSFTEILARVFVLFTAITIHEFAHGFVAYKLGDPTAKYSGRLTFNPIAHLDPVGAVCMALFGFGWAKPVPVNPMYFKNRKRDNVLVALAGPLANLLLAFVFAFAAALYSKFGNVFYVNGYIYNYSNLPILQFGFLLLIQLVFLNIGFAVFNLIPFPPLDGSKILGAFIPQQKYNKLLMFEHFGFLIIMLLSLSGVLGVAIDFFRVPLIKLWTICYEWFLSIL